jgi:Ca2+-binding EF-hand superfamily protein
LTSASDLRERNIGSVFELLDTDRDGYITEDDLPASGRRILDALGIEDAQQRAEILGLYQSAWEQLRADCDSDSDGRITRQEFTSAFTVGLGDPQAYFQRLMGPIPDRIAEVADRDGDGFIESDEYARIFAPIGVDEQVIRAAFERLDADSDGKISTGEFREAMRHLFLSHDPADPGTSVLG